MNRLRLLMLATIATCGLWASTASAQAQRQIIIPDPPPGVNPDKPLVIVTYIELPFGHILRLPDPQNFVTRPSNGQPYTVIVPASADSTGSTPQQIISVPVYAQPIVTVPVYVEQDPYEDPYYYRPWVIPALGVNRSNWGLDNRRPIGGYRR
jgi:hypothetical protein